LTRSSSGIWKAERFQHAGVEHQEDVALDRDHRGADAHLLE